MTSDPVLAARTAWLSRREFNWAHQGGSKEGPSNTIRAMRDAMRNGASGLEMDIHLTRDNRLVVAHDEKLERTTNGRGRIRSHRLRNLQKLDAAYWWVPGFVDKHDAQPTEYLLRTREGKRVPHDLTLPTLDEVLDTFPEVPMTLEVKKRRVVKRFVRFVEERELDLTKVIVVAFQDGTVRKLRRAEPDLPLAPGRIWQLWFVVRTLFRVAPRSTPYVAVQAPFRLGAVVPAFAKGVVPQFIQKIRLINKHYVRCAHRAEMAVHAWTIDDEPDMRKLLRLGVDGIMTDRPSALKRVLSER